MTDRHGRDVGMIQFAEQVRESHTISESGLATEVSSRKTNVMNRIFGAENG